MQIGGMHMHQGNPGFEQERLKAVAIRGIEVGELTAVTILAFLGGTKKHPVSRLIEDAPQHLPRAPCIGLGLSVPITQLRRVYTRQPNLGAVPQADGITVVDMGDLAVRPLRITRTSLGDGAARRPTENEKGDQ